MCSMPFVNTMVGANDEDVRNLGDHFQDQFSEAKGRIQQARHFLNPKLRIPFESAAITKFIGELLGREKRGAEEPRIVHRTA